MHATVRRYEGTPRSPEEFRRSGRRLAPTLAKVPGFVSYALLETVDGVLASVSICETPASLAEANRVLAGWEAESLALPAHRSPAVSTGEVIMQLGL
jgi:hypothetical protein